MNDITIVPKDNTISFNDLLIHNNKLLKREVDFLTFINESQRNSIDSLFFLLRSHKLDKPAQKNHLKIVGQKKG